MFSNRGACAPSPARRCRCAAPGSAARLLPLSLSFETFDVFDSRAGVENNDSLAAVDLARSAKFLQRGKAGRALRRDEQTFFRANFPRTANHVVIIDGEGAAAILAQDFQDQEIANRFRPA